MDRRRKGKTGLTLVELLVVLGIIATISAVSIPVIARSGLFTSNKSQLAARELFTVLRAAKIYATTHNVETAVAYGGLLVLDSFSDENVPVVDSVAVVRRLKRSELLLHNLGANQVLFVPISSGDGGFRRLPNDTCILPDIFEYDPDLEISTTGLRAIVMWDLENGLPIEPRLDYILGDPNDDFDDIFPAHRFSPEGALLVDSNLSQQRLRFRVGVLPSAEPSDRFFIDFSDTELVPEDEESVTVLFTDPDIIDPRTVTIYHDPDRLDPDLLDTPIDIDVDIFLYVPTGRVKVGS